MLGLGPCWQAENPDGSWDISDFEADPGRSQRASSDSRYFLAYGMRMGCLDRTGRYNYTDETKTENRISNSSRPAVSGRIRGDGLQFIDLSNSSFQYSEAISHRQCSQLSDRNRSECELKPFSIDRTLAVEMAADAPKFQFFPYYGFTDTRSKTWQISIVEEAGESDPPLCPGDDAASAAPPCGGFVVQRGA